MRLALLIILLFLSFPGRIFANIKATDATITYTDTTIQGMDSIKFLSLNGNDTIVPFYITYASYDTGIFPIYTLEDPTADSNKPRPQNIPEHLDKDLIHAILALNLTLSTKQIANSTGISLTDNEYISATQVAIWEVVSNNSQKYRLDIESIQNVSIKSTALWLIETAQDFLGKKPSHVTVLDYMSPPATFNVNTSKAQGNVEDKFNYYGPYTLESVVTNLRIAPATPPPNYALVNSISGTVIENVGINDFFYVRFDKNLIGELVVPFSTEISVAKVMEYERYVSIHTIAGSFSTSLTIGNFLNTGKIVYTKTDAITNTAITGVVLEVRDQLGSLVCTMTTDKNGVATSPDLKVGYYQIKESNTIQGYSLDPIIYEATIKGSGEIIRLTSKAKIITSLVTFLCNDKATGTPVGGSIFAILDSEGSTVTKIGFTDSGRCANIQLNPGFYTLRELDSSFTYELIVDQLKFEAIAGEIIEVPIIKSTALNHTYIRVENDSGVGIPNILVEIYNDIGFLITEMKTNGDGEIALSLPPGKYIAKQQGSQVIEGGSSHSFQVLSSSKDNIVYIGITNYKSYITGYVFDTADNPIAGVGLVALDDLGREYSVSTSNFEGAYTLKHLPDNAVIYVIIYKAPYGFSGKTLSDRVLTLTQENFKDITILSLDELNAELLEENQILTYDFYKLKSESQIESQTDANPLGLGNLDSITSVSSNSSINRPSTEPIPEINPSVEPSLREEPVPQIAQESNKSFPVAQLLLVIFVLLAIGISRLIIRAILKRKNSLSKIDAPDFATSVPDNVDSDDTDDSDPVKSASEDSIKENMGESSTEVLIERGLDDEI